MTVHAPTPPHDVVKAGKVEIGNAKKLAIIAGPCQLESRAREKLREIVEAEKLDPMAF